jgi:hypothetical protein
MKKAETGHNCMCRSETVFAGLRFCRARMVIANRHGYCWTVPVTLDWLFMTHAVRILRRPVPISGRRFKASWPAGLATDRAKAPCRVIDISSHGAGISTVAELALDTEMELILDNAPPIRGTIVWRQNNCLGIRFANQQPWVQTECAKRFDPAAWLS